MSKDLTAKTISIQDIIDTFDNYGGSPEIDEPILYFISELTNISVDELVNMTHIGNM